MTSALLAPQPATINHKIIAGYRNHFDAETAIGRLCFNWYADKQYVSQGKPHYLVHT